MQKLGDQFPLELLSLALSFTYLSLVLPFLALQQAVTKLKRILIVLCSLAVSLVLIFYFSYNPADIGFFPKCPFYSFTGFFCPGCGSQRAMHQLLHGHVFTGLKHNFLIVLLFAVLVYDFSIFILNRYTKKTVKNLLHKPVTTYAILALIISFWVLRNIDLYPFTILAP